MSTSLQLLLAFLIVVLSISSVITGLLKAGLKRRQEELEEEIKPKPMVVSVTLSSADVEEDDEQERIGNQ